MLTFLCRLGKNDVDMQAGWFLVEVCLSLYRAVYMKAFNIFKITTKLIDTYSCYVV